MNTQVTISAASSAMALAGEPSSQVTDSRSQPAGTFSETEYVPGSRRPELFDCPSDSENPSAS